MQASQAVSKTHAKAIKRNGYSQHQNSNKRHHATTFAQVLHHMAAVKDGAEPSVNSPRALRKQLFV